MIIKTEDFLYQFKASIVFMFDSDIEKFLLFVVSRQIV